MNKSEQTPTLTATTPSVDAPRRAWVTPAFEQVALKEALNGPGTATPGDGSGSSS